MSSPEESQEAIINNIDTMHSPWKENKPEIEIYDINERKAHEMIKQGVDLTPLAKKTTTPPRNMNSGRKEVSKTVYLNKRNIEKRTSSEVNPDLSMLGTDPRLRSFHIPQA